MKDSRTSTIPSTQGLPTPIASQVPAFQPESNGMGTQFTPQSPTGPKPERPKATDESKKHIAFIHNHCENLGIADEGVLVLSLIEPDKKLHPLKFQVGDVDGMAVEIRGRAKFANVYLGLFLVRKDLERGRRGKFEDIIVLKRLAKWALFGVLGLVAIITIIFGGYQAYDYITVKFPKSKVEISLEINNEGCKGTAFPVLLTVKNLSDKTILYTWVYAEARRKGHSTNLARYRPTTLDAIIEPGNGYIICTQPQLASNTSKDIKVEELVWSVESYRVRFK